MKTLVLYHAGCADGFCAAWIARKKFGDNADYVPVNYGQPPPDVSGRDVYILNFSFKRPIVVEMSQTAKKLVILDHHKSAEKELFGLSCGSNEGLIRFDMDKSGGRLAWDYFSAVETRQYTLAHKFFRTVSPWLVDYTEDRDLWRWKLPRSKAISAFIRSYPFEFDRWNEWDRIPVGMDPMWTSLADEGDAILRYQQQLVDSAVEVATEIEMDGHKVLSVNTTCMVSEIGEQLAAGRPFSATYFIAKDGKKVWSLRSREGGVDVSEIARKHGGGGHKQAAGFTE